jgi:hypothetical protein
VDVPSWHEELAHMRLTSALSMRVHEDKLLYAAESCLVVRMGSVEMLVLHLGTDLGLLDQSVLWVLPNGVAHL